MKNYIPKSSKSLSTQNIINQALDILESVGISFNDKKERTLENMAMSFLAVASVINSWVEVKNIEENWLLTTREIIKFINENFEESKALSSYDDIKRRDLEPLLVDNLILNRSRAEISAPNDPTRGFTLHQDFKKLIKLYGTKEWKTSLKDFNEKRTSTLTDIPLIHDRVFEFLSNWSESILVPIYNRFFHIRTREDERFRKGYWFPGDENYVAVSFWAGGDSLNKTQNIYISISPKNGVYAHLVARDSKNKEAYFEILANQLNGYTKSRRQGEWVKLLSQTVNENLLEVIQNYISTDKLIIDDFLHSTLDNPEGNEYKLLEDEYSSRFGFISEEQFYRLKSRVDAQRLKEKFKKEESIPQTSNIDSQLPISLLSLAIENFQGIKKTELNNLPTDAKWIFLTGENGFGKTSILQALTLGLTKYTETEDYIKKDSKIEVRYIDNGNPVVNSTSFYYTDDFIPINFNLIAYGPIRLNTQASSTENQESKNSGNVYNLFERDGVLKNFNYLLRISRLKNDGLKEFNNLKNAVIEILDNRISNIDLDSNGEIVYFETDKGGNILAKNDFENLATGFRSLINMVGDIIVRYSENYPILKYEEYTGIVIIDELENHLHPIFQKRLPELLSGIFPKIQFITSVHSPIPLLGAPENSVIIKVNRDSEKQITLERIIIDNIESLTPNILYTSPIFGFTSIINDNLTDFKKLRTEDSWQDMEDNDELDKELLELYNSRKKD